ncbi:zinc dependent phospholipase C family protein [uncultured Eubacterium sp.]|uniref:zinc dependent phospholipase C family protein n=1 Tax=uncultured Eubacterium sp. TaxID=165185 RepID=UPI0015A7CFA3|nr:zinc dependent phospholipase C family protein [uncultured Eubacterium sp.]
MPAFCTHYLFFEDSKEFMCSLADFPLNEKVCALGSQGADIFFFHKIYSPLHSKRKIGSALHRAKPEDIFNVFAEYVRKNPDPTAKSYIYGFILHYALDRRCHPFVYALEKKITDSDKKIHHFSAHSRVEMGLDAYMLYQKSGTEYPYLFDSSKTIELNDREKDSVAKVLCYMIKKVLKKRISRLAVKRAINDTVRMQKFLRDKSGQLCILATVLETILGKAIGYYKFSAMIKPRLWKNGEKYANIDNGIWISPFSKEKSNLSFEQLYIYALQEAKELLIGFEQTVSGKTDAKDVTENISFLTGLEIK